MKRNKLVFVLVAVLVFLLAVEAGVGWWVINPISS
jgi:hypothetical protein